MASGFFAIGLRRVEVVGPDLTRPLPRFPLGAVRLGRAVVSNGASAATVDSAAIPLVDFLLVSTTV